MPNQNNSDRQELEELLRQMDELLAPPEEEEDFDVEAYAPQDLEDDEPILYQNYSNRYGADVKNFSNGYGTGASQSLEQELNSVPAYNADFRSNTCSAGTRLKRSSFPGNARRSRIFTKTRSRSLKKRRKSPAGESAGEWAA